MFIKLFEQWKSSQLGPENIIWGESQAGRFPQEVWLQFCLKPTLHLSKSQKVHCIFWPKFGLSGSHFLFYYGYIYTHFSHLEACSSVELSIFIVLCIHLQTFVLIPTDIWYPLNSCPLPSPSSFQLPPFFLPLRPGLSYIDQVIWHSTWPFVFISLNVIFPRLIGVVAPIRISFFFQVE